MAVRPRLLLRRSPLPLLILAALAAVVHLRTRPPRTADADSAITVDVARQLFPSAASLGAIRPGRSIEVTDAAGAALGSLWSTTPIAAEHPGYAGPVPCVIGITPDGRVAGIRLLPNEETLTFVEFVAEQGLLESWTGLTVAEAAAKRVDATSGATMTSLAIIDEVQHALATRNASPERHARIAWTAWLAWTVLGLSLLGFCLGGRFPWLRLVLRPANVVVLGFLMGTCLSLAAFRGWLAHGLAWSRYPFLACLAMTALLLPVLSGRGFYCAHVCPYGGVQDLVAWLWSGRRPRLPRRVADGLHLLRALALLTVYVLVVAGVAVDLAILEPFAAFQWRSAPWSACALAGAFALLTLPFPRLWCQHLCPTGYLLEQCRGQRPRDGAPAAAIFSFERVALLAALAAALLLAAQSTRPAVEGAGPDGGDARTAMGLADEPPRQALIPDVLTAMRERRSVRSYTDDPVRPAQLDTLLRAAMAAPSMGNAQPWAFVVVTERKRLQGLADALPDGSILTRAGAALVVCGVPARGLPGEAAAFWVQDCAAAAENVILAAQGIGLGAVWMGVYPVASRSAGIRAACDLPAEVTPLCVVSLGQPAGVEPSVDRYDPDRVHWERW